MNNIRKFIIELGNRLQIHTIRTKMVLSFLIIGLVPLITFALFSYNIYQGAIKDRIIDHSREVVYRIERDIDDYFSDIESFLTREQDFYLNQYIRLTQVNDFDNNRKYTFRIWEDFNNLQQMKPGLEVQALVENAIYHGILPSSGKGLIVIKGYLEGDYIYFEVIDNGTGIGEEKVREINQILAGSKEPVDEKQYFGLRNVNQRIKLKYGDECGLKVESTEGEKTVSIIKIGILEAGENDVSTADS